MMTSCLLLAAAPLVSLGTPVRADNGGNFLGQAQRFLDNRGDDRSDRRGDYERGRDDEMRRQQAERDRYRDRRDDDRGVWSSDDRDRPRYGGDNRNYR